jgi:hypothetical protein
VRFDYYQRLNKTDRAIYRVSDEYDAIELEHPRALRPLATKLGSALAADDRVAVDKLAQRLVTGISRQMGVRTASSRVEAARPRSSGEELHGLYIREDGERPVIVVWMRTAARRRPVAHRAFLRTLLHEVCHHLDYELLGLADSFHTPGFFQRESSLMRQLLPAPRRVVRPKQLTLFE